jgi:hypothetical protein
MIRGERMRVVATVVALALFPATAHADMMERRTARIIRSAGHWCDRVSDLQLDKRKSTPERRVVLVTCYDIRHFVQYELTVGSDNKVRTIKKM